MKRVIPFLLAALPLFAQQTPPPPAAPREAKLPQPVEKKLANGLRVIVVPKHDLPLVAAGFMVKNGAAADPREREGVAQLTATVLKLGTKTKSAEEVARGIEALGATLSSDARWDAMTVDVSVMSENLPAALGFVTDVVRNPTFPEDELQRERAQAIDGLQASLAQPRTLAGAVISRLIFGEAPYSANLPGTPESLAKITRQDLVKFHAAHFRPGNAVLVLAGDVKADAGFALAEKLFGSWKVSEPAKPSLAKKEQKLPAPRVLVIDMPDAGQSAVVVGRLGIKRTDPAYLKSLVTNSVLGGGYSSRLNQKIRIERGLSYGAGSSFAARANAGPFTVRTETKHESVAEVVEIIVAEMSRLSAAPVPESELVPRKAALIGDFGQSVETTSGIVEAVSELALYNLPLSDMNKFVGGVQAVTAEEVRAFAAAQLTADSSVVIVGDASKFIEPLRKQFKNVEVIAAGELDLNSPALRVRKEKE